MCFDIFVTIFKVFLRTYSSLFSSQEKICNKTEISGAREEDLTDPHPVLRLNRPAQHRRFFLNHVSCVFLGFWLCYFFALFVALVCLSLFVCLCAIVVFNGLVWWTSSWNIWQEWPKDKPQVCNSAWVERHWKRPWCDKGDCLSPLKNGASIMTLIVTKKEGSPPVFGRLAQTIRILARSGSLPRNTRAETMNVRPPRNIWLLSRHCPIIVGSSYNQWDTCAENIICQLVKYLPTIPSKILLLLLIIRVTPN